MSNDWGGEGWSDDGGDWGTPGRAEGFDGDGRPTAVPPGSGLGVDDIQIARNTPTPNLIGGAITTAWERVKERPFETILLAFLSMIFGQGGSGCNNVANLIPSDTGDSSYQSDYDYSDFGGSIFDSVTGSLPDLAGAISGGEVALIAILAGIFMMVFVVVLVLSTLIQGGSTIFWLRLLRGQPAELGHTTAATRFFVMLLVTNILYGLAIFGGFLALIIPGFILIYGFLFAGYVVVDKNLGYVDALKASWRITNGHKLEIFALSIILGLMNFAGVLMCCVGVFVTHAIGMGAMMAVYDQLAVPGNAYLDPGEEYGNV